LPKTWQDTPGNQRADTRVLITSSVFHLLDLGAGGTLPHSIIIHLRRQNNFQMRLEVGPTPLAHGCLVSLSRMLLCSARVNPRLSWLLKIELGCGKSTLEG
jgi:hypothetical protein